MSINIRRLSLVVTEWISANALVIFLLIIDAQYNWFTEAKLQAYYLFNGSYIPF